MPLKRNLKLFTVALASLMLSHCGSQKDDDLSVQHSADAGSFVACNQRGVAPKDEEKHIEDNKGKPSTPPTTTPVEENDYYDLYDLVKQVRKVPGNVLNLELASQTTSLCKILESEKSTILVLHLIPNDCEGCTEKSLGIQEILANEKGLKQIIVTIDDKPIENLPETSMQAIDSQSVFANFFQLEKNYKVLIMNKYSEGILSQPEDLKEAFDSLNKQ